MGGFCGELLNENDFEAILATFCCYHYDANASETGGSLQMKKIITNAPRVL